MKPLSSPSMWSLSDHHDNRFLVQDCSMSPSKSRTGLGHCTRHPKGLMRSAELSEDWVRKDLCQARAREARKDP